jgi:hypothetical protein
VPRELKPQHKYAKLSKKKKKPHPEFDDDEPIFQGYIKWTKEFVTVQE